MVAAVVEVEEGRRGEAMRDPNDAGDHASCPGGTLPFREPLKSGRLWKHYGHGHEERVSTLSVGGEREKEGESFFFPLLFIAYPQIVQIIGRKQSSCCF